MPKPRVAVLIGPKGHGSNMLNLAKFLASEDAPAELATVIAPSEAIPSVKRAREAGLLVDVLSPSEPNYPEELLALLARNRCDWICLAGYLSLLPKVIVEAFPNRILNTHPALLPKFGGKGMYGLRVHEAVLAAGEKETGCTIHYVNENYDEGEIIIQRICTIEPNDTPETLMGKVQKLEHETYPKALTLAIERDAARRRV